ncbi:MAG TPA: nucleotidyl transferase AbiEii/AbiGii toxin family protein [Candidatus Omnitrophota bacterium]|nr:nucleotidyl transferase AbiEii/AbiGii toxin family protein [Candidatus Omnitrophota bacterium]
MNDALKVMLDRYQCRSWEDYENALKEMIQQIALLGLWRSKFFEKAAFYGGSALRILYGLDRFSEDLDFSLLKRNTGFSLAEYTGAVEHELRSFGFAVTVEKKIKSVETCIESAFIKAGTIQNMLVIDTPREVVGQVHKRKELKVKFEVDVDPPPGFAVEAKFLFQPLPFSVNAYAPADLFAGKIQACLCRSWKNRVKGRDWYDLVWHVSRDIPVHLEHLEQRLRQSGDLEAGVFLTGADLERMLLEKIGQVDFDLARQDVKNFLKDPAPLSLWSKEYFQAVCAKIRCV